MEKNQAAYYYLYPPKRDREILPLSVQTSLHLGCRQFVFMDEWKQISAFGELLEMENVYWVVPPIESVDSHQIPAAWHTVILDWDRDDLAAALLAYGYDMAQKGFFSWFGRSWFYEKSKVEEIVRSVAVVAAEGTSLLMEYINEGLAASLPRKLITAASLEAESDEIVRSSFTYPSLEALFEKYGFYIFEESHGGKEKEPCSSGSLAVCHAVKKGKTGKK